MLVSAISANHGNSYTMSGYTANENVRSYSSRPGETIGDTAFNSLNAFSKKSTPVEKLPVVFDSINQWKKFCQARVLGEKLNVVV